MLATNGVVDHLFQLRHIATDVFLFSLVSTHLLEDDDAVVVNDVLYDSVQ